MPIPIRSGFDAPQLRVYFDSLWVDPACWFRPQTRKPRQLRHILPCKRQLDHSTWSRHDPTRLVQQITEQGYKRRVASTESPPYEWVQGIDRLVVDLGAPEIGTNHMRAGIALAEHYATEALRLARYLTARYVPAIAECHWR